MYVVSEITGEKYNSVDECIVAEKEFSEKKAKEEAKKKELADTRKARAKEVKDAYKLYEETLSAFINDYGSWHYSYTSDDIKNSQGLFNFFEFF